MKDKDIDIVQIEKECREDLKEIASFYCGWDELRKVIDQLEDNDNEAAWMRSMEGEPETQAERDERHFSYQKLK